MLTNEQLLLPPEIEGLLLWLLTSESSIWLVLSLSNYRWYVWMLNFRIHCSKSKAKRVLLCTNPPAGLGSSTTQTWYVPTSSFTITAAVCRPKVIPTNRIVCISGSVYCLTDYIITNNGGNTVTIRFFVRVWPDLSLLSNGLLMHHSLTSCEQT